MYFPLDFYFYLNVQALKCYRKKNHHIKTMQKWNVIVIKYLLHRYKDFWFSGANKVDGENIKDAVLIQRPGHLIWWQC